MFLNPCSLATKSATEYVLSTVSIQLRSCKDCLLMSP